MDHPASIGKYELEEFLGGGMSHVYRARDRVLGRTVCVKVLTPQGCADQDVRDRFLLEARLAGNFCHDNVVSVYDFGEDNGKPFMVMEYLRGDTLRKLMAEGRLGSLRETLQIALQLASALECVHQQNIIHRDIKPENVHVGPHRNVKLMDFGIAKAHGLSMTQAGFVLGTPYYMSPEQVRGEDVTPQVDVYSYGAMLYELLAGRKPFRAETPEAIFYSILSESVDPEPLQQARIPLALRDLVLRSMSKNPQERPRGFGEISAQLSQIIAALDAESGAVVAPGSEQTTALPTPRANPAPAPARAPAVLPEVKSGRAGRIWWAVAGVAVLVALASVWFVIRLGSLPKTITTPTGEMVLVPAGIFERGEMRDPVTLPAFYIDKTEVSNAQFSNFCKASGCTAPMGDPNLPVVNVTIGDARRFASWAGKRLPKDAEWEKAARGTDGRKYPWGDAWDPALANIAGAGLMPVDGFPKGASPFGVLQMAGNAWELVDTARSGSEQAIRNLANKLTPPPTLDEPWITIRGGSFNSKPAEAVAWEWARVPERFFNPQTGFRCVKDAK